MNILICKYLKDIECPRQMEKEEELERILLGETSIDRVIPLNPFCPNDSLTNENGIPCCYKIYNRKKGESKMLLKDLIEQYADYEVKEGFMDFLERPKPKSVWDLKDGDIYFYLCDNGIVGDSTWNNDYIDNTRINIGNMFLTKTEAEFEKRKIEVYEQVKRFAYDFSREEWKNCDIFKYFPYFSYTANNIDFSLSRGNKHNRLYFKSEEDIKKAIEEVGEENFIKYYLGVRE